MLILGYHGSTNIPFGPRHNHSPDRGHDSSAVLLEDGKIIAAIEGERLNRKKHSSFFPLEAIEFCLKLKGVKPSDLDVVATASVRNKDFLNYAFPELTDDKFYLCSHELAHVYSAYYQSGFDSCLALSLDGVGDDNDSGVIAKVINGNFITLKSFPIKHSIGNFYTKAVYLLGLQPFSEYKIMGLAPYGDKTKHEEMFSKYFYLNDDGGYELYHEELYQDLIKRYPAPRARNGFTQFHKDIAAAFQDVTEKIALHILRHFQKETGLKNLAYAGGVAQNSTLNGKLLHSNIFDDIFIHPAAHDSGLALGAALSAAAQHSRIENKRIQHCYWGSDIGTNATIEDELSRWSPSISYKHHNNIPQVAAEALASGKVIGWVQGKSEFGPRALGNRSILADPRPAENKTKINAIIKFREEFRPFAPSIIEEEADKFFELPKSTRELPFMTCVVNVKPSKRELLGAVTHIDGTARLQTVSKNVNPLYWDLINHFGQLTSVPVILNTSFNNNVEPIVDSIENAINCFLSTNLDYLFIGNFQIERSNKRESFLKLVPKLMIDVDVTSRTRLVEKDTVITSYYVEDGYYLNSKDDYLGACYGITSRQAAIKRFAIEVNKDTYDILRGINNTSTLEVLVDTYLHNKNNIDALLKEVVSLWRKRLITFSAAI